MLIPLKPGELLRLIPAVATGPQFSASSGNPRKLLQRVLISVIGGVISLLISQVLLFRSQVGPGVPGGGIRLPALCALGPDPGGGPPQRHPAPLPGGRHLRGGGGRSVHAGGGGGAARAGRPPGAAGAGGEQAHLAVPGAGGRGRLPGPDALSRWRRSTRRSGGAWWSAAWC